MLTLSRQLMSSGLVKSALICLAVAAVLPAQSTPAATYAGSVNLIDNNTGVSYSSGDISSTNTVPDTIWASNGANPESAILSFNSTGPGGSVLASANSGPEPSLCLANGGTGCWPQNGTANGVASFYFTVVAPSGTTPAASVPIVVAGSAAASASGDGFVTLQADVFGYSGGSSFATQVGVESNYTCDVGANSSGCGTYMYQIAGSVPAFAPASLNNQVGSGEIRLTNQVIGEGTIYKCSASPYGCFTASGASGYISAESVYIDPTWLAANPGYTILFSAGFSNATPSTASVQLQSPSSGPITVSAANFCPAGQFSPAPCSQTRTLTYLLTGNVTFGTPIILTDGAPGLDFTLGSNNSCLGTLSAGATCSLAVNFTPQFAGLRSGAVELVDNNGNNLNTTYLNGAATTPQIVFVPGVADAVTTSDLESATAVAVDGAGNLFVADAIKNAVVKVPAGGGAQSMVGSGLSAPQGVAVDAAGNIYIADTGNNRVVEVAANRGAQTTLAFGLSAPQGVAIDASGRVYIADTGNRRVLEVSPGNLEAPLPATGLSRPVAVAVDAAGDVLIADAGLNQVVEMPVIGTQTTVGSGLLTPSGVAIDVGGNVFIADQGNSRVVEVAAFSGAQSVVASGNAAMGVGVSAAGDVFLAGGTSKQVSKLTRSQPPAVTFPVTLVGGTSNAQSVTAQNIGNAPLSFTGLSVSANFAQVAGSGTPADCSTQASVGPGAVCNLSLAFTPMAAGGISGSATLTDNAASGTQSIALSGSGSASVRVTVSANIPGAAFSIDGTSYTSPQTLIWSAGTTHTLSAPGTQIPATGTQYSFNGWSDGGAVTHTVAASEVTTSFTANFVTQYLLTTAVNLTAGGTVTASGYFNAGTSVAVTATPAAGYLFTNWAGLVASASNASTSVIMNEPISVTALFAVANTATYTGLDATTQGTWTGKYGSDGCLIAKGTMALPAYATVNVIGENAYTWSSFATDPRALQTASGASTRIASAYYSSSGYTIKVNFADGNVHRVALYLLDWDGTTRTESIQILNAATNAILDTETYVSFHNGEYAAWNISGNVIIKVTKTGGSNAVISGIFFDPAARVATPSAVYSGLDTITQGNWSSQYGADGRVIAGEPAALPSYGTFNVTGGTAYTWATSTTDPRALQTASGAFTRIAATYYSYSGYTISVNLTDGNTHRIALYLLDWDSTTRAETIQILNATTYAVLDTETYSGFHNGEYAAWNIQGNVIIKVTKTGGSNAVVSGLFFGAVPVAATATYSGLDTTTQGGWTGKYGSLGDVIANDANNPPAVANITFTGDNIYTWADFTGDVRALQTASGATSGIASTYYSSSAFGINLNLTDGKTHKIALYLVDWDGTARTESIQILDAYSKAVLDTETYASFHNGEYAVWNVTGDVVIEVTKTGGANGVVSGVFVD